MATFWLAEYEGAEPTLWTTADAARDWCDDMIRSEARNQGWDWDPDGDSEQQVWVADLDDRRIAQAPGRITPLTPDVK